MSFGFAVDTAECSCAKRRANCPRVHDVPAPRKTDPLMYCCDWEGSRPDNRSMRRGRKDLLGGPRNRAEAATSASLGLCPARSPHCYQDEPGPQSTRARSYTRSPMPNFTTQDSCSGCTRTDRGSRRTIHRLPYRSWRADRQFHQGYASACRSAMSSLRSRRQ
jgi:hypothetical protein